MLFIYQSVTEADMLIKLNLHWSKGLESIYLLVRKKKSF